VLLRLESTITRNILYSAVILFGIAVLGAFWDFYSGDKRLNHQINSVQGSSFLSSFYRIYFPVVLLSIVFYLLIAFALLPEEDGGWGALDPSISPSSNLVNIIPAILTGIGIIALSDFEMKKRNLLYAPRGKQFSYLKSLVYMAPLLGLYFGVRFLIRFIITQTQGKGALIPVSQNFYTIDANLLSAARFWIFLTDEEKILTFIGFITLYIAMEVLLRGLLANEARSYNLGPGGMIFIPAVIQAVAFSSGTFVFSDPIYYLVSLFEAFMLGMIIGIVLWRTGRFSATITIALLARMLDNTLDFYSTMLHLLPEPFGVYDPVDSVVTRADNIGVFLVYIQVLLVILAPLVLIVAYEEVWKVTSQLYRNLKSQWFGYLVIAIAFFIIDLIFSYFGGMSLISPVLGFIISLIILGILLNYLFQVLPAPKGPEDLVTITDPFEGEYPVDVISDIKWIESSPKWYSSSILVGFLGSGLFIYLVFLAGAYRQFSVLSSSEMLKFSTFLILLPSILFGIASHLLSVSITRGYYFADDYRKMIFGILISFYLINLYIWTISAALVSFAWRNVPFFVMFALLIWPKPIRSPSRDYAFGLAKSGRYATYRNVKHDPSLFIKEFDNLRELPSDTIKVGIHILGAELGLVTEWDQIELLRKNNSNKGNKVGGALTLGMIGTSASEGVLLNVIGDEDIDAKIAAFWALGKVGTTKILPRMSQVLEDNPIKGLIQIAEEAILRIDPNYPLAGLRDSITIE
jgi:hypothetical protein